MKRNTYISAILILTALLLAGCNHKDLVYSDFSHNVYVRFDWSQAPQARPGGMLLWVFADDTQPVSITAPRDGKAVILSDGGYRLIAHNDNNDVIVPTGDTYSDFLLHTTPAALANVSPMFAATRNVPRAAGTESEPLVYEPAETWTSALPQAVVPAGGDVTFTMPMQSATTTYTFIIDDIDNLDYVVDLSATLSGMCDAWSPADALGSDIPCTIPFAIRKTGEASLEGAVRTFGHCPAGYSQHSHWLIVFAEMKNGQRWYYSYDVTSQMHDGHDPSVPISLSGLPFPKPITNGSGLQPDVGDWQAVGIDLEM